MFMHLRLLWQPPLFFAHSFTSKYTHEQIHVTYNKSSCNLPRQSTNQHSEDVSVITSTVYVYGTYTGTNLCSPSRRCWCSQLDSCRMTWIRPCSCIYVCCDSRRCFLRTRSHLSASMSDERVCVLVSQNISPLPTRWITYLK